MLPQPFMDFNLWQLREKFGDYVNSDLVEKLDQMLQKI